MKIALAGYGKMGKLIEEMALKEGHEIVCKFAESNESTFSGKLQLADVCIDFSHASCVIKNVHSCGKLGIPLIIGTTGWESEMHTAIELTSKYQIGCLYSPNFSIGIYLFSQIVENAAHLLNAFDNYDIAGIEFHHKTKKDSPSGTANALRALIEKEVQRITPMSFSSIRCGQIPGIHTILIDSAEDTITLTHEARNRNGFAKGAIIAANWIKHRKGFFTLNDMLKEL